MLSPKVNLCLSSRCARLHERLWPSEQRTLPGLYTCAKCKTSLLLIIQSCSSLPQRKVAKRVDCALFLSTGVEKIGRLLHKGFILLLWTVNDLGPNSRSIPVVRAICHWPASCTNYVWRQDCLRFSLKTNSICVRHFREYRPSFVGVVCHWPTVIAYDTTKARIGWNFSLKEEFQCKSFDVITVPRSCWWRRS